MRSDSNQIFPSHVEAVLHESGIAQVTPVSTSTNAALSLQLGSSDIRPLAEQVAELECQAIAAAMNTAKGNKVVAAKMLGISRAMLYDRLQKMH